MGLWGNATGEERGYPERGEWVAGSETMKIAHLMVAAMVGGALGLSGCYAPYPYPYGYPPPAATPSAFDRAWGAAVGALRDQGVQVSREDRSTGIVEGQRGALTVTAHVITQADGRVRVQFDTRGDLSTDPTLSERVSRAYDARMGR